MSPTRLRLRWAKSKKKILNYHLTFIRCIDRLVAQHQWHLDWITQIQNDQVIWQFDDSKDTVLEISSIKLSFLDWPNNWPYLAIYAAACQVLFGRVDWDRIQPQFTHENCSFTFPFNAILTESLFRVHESSCIENVTLCLQYNVKCTFNRC